MEATMFNWKTRECVQEVLALTFALFLMFALAAPAQAFFPIGIAIGGAMVGGAMQAERQQSQQSEQYQRREQYQRNEQYQRSENGEESKHTKKTTKAKNHKRERDVKIAKAKAPEPVANAPQAKPLRADPPPSPDKFGE
jgi:flagellar biosynthesis component FlhA